MPVAPERSGVRRWLMVGCGAVAGLAVLLIVAGLAVSRHGAGEPTRANTTVLPDGSLVRLEAVTFGTQHRWESEKDPFAWLPGWLRWPPGRTLPDAVEETTGRDCTVFWITRRDADRPRQTLDMVWWTDYEVVDEHGCRFGDGTRRCHVQVGGIAYFSTASRGSTFSPSQPREDAIRVGTAALAAVPHRSSVWTLRLYAAATQPIAEFSVPNAAGGLYPTWAPEPLPATRRAGDLAVTLLSVSGSERVNASRGARVPRRDLLTSFRLRQRGRPAPEWKADEFLFDATGNDSPASTLRLCAWEAAWKLRAKFWRTPRARFAPSETWSIPGVRGPRAGHVVPLTGTKTLNGVSLELMGIAGPGRVRYTNGVPSAVRLTAQELRRIGNVRGVSIGGPTSSINVDSDCSHLSVRVRGLSADQRLMVHAKDQRGRVFVGQFQVGMSHQYFWRLDIPEDSRTLKLRFVVHSPRTVEFMIAPPKFVRRGGS